MVHPSWFTDVADHSCLIKARMDVTCIWRFLSSFKNQGEFLPGLISGAASRGSLQEFSSSLTSLFWFHSGEMVLDLGIICFTVWTSGSAWLCWKPEASELSFQLPISEILQWFAIFLKLCHISRTWWSFWLFHFVHTCVFQDLQVLRLWFKSTKPFPYRKKKLKRQIHLFASSIGSGVPCSVKAPPLQRDNQVWQPFWRKPGTLPSDLYHRSEEGPGLYWDLIFKGPKRGWRGILWVGDANPQKPLSADFVGDFRFQLCMCFPFQAFPSITGRLFSRAFNSHYSYLLISIHKKNIKLQEAVGPVFLLIIQIVPWAPIANIGISFGDFRFHHSFILSKILSFKILKAKQMDSCQTYVRISVFRI